MKNKRLFGLIWLPVLGGFILGHGLAGEVPQSQNRSERLPPLIRMDLLVKSSVPLKPPLRNIFKPDRRRDVSENPTLPPPPEADQTPLEQPNESVQEESVLQLRYIGYISSQGKVVAVILLNGQAMAVQKGEMIAESFTVVKITRQELEYAGEGSEIRRVLFEGEE